MAAPKSAGVLPASLSKKDADALFQAALAQRANDSSSDAVTEQERAQLASAWSKPEFQAIFMDYVREIQDPATRAENEAFLRQAAADSSVAASVGGLPPGMALVTPEAVFALSATTTSGKRVFINVCRNARIPAPEPSSNASAIKLPHLVGNVHMEPDDRGVMTATHDVCVHPDAFNPAYTAALIDTAVEVVSSRGDPINASSVSHLSKAVGLPGVMSVKTASLTAAKETAVKRPAPAPVSEPLLPSQHKTVVRTAPRYNGAGQVVLQPRVELVERFKSGLTAATAPVQVVFKVHLRWYRPWPLSSLKRRSTVCPCPRHQR